MKTAPANRATKVQGPEDSQEQQGEASQEMRAALYIGVSTGEQAEHGFSVPEQRARDKRRIT